MDFMKVIILDRDGIINHDSEYYIKSIDEFVFLPGSVDAIVKLTKNHYRIGIATNQSGIARGLYDTDILNEIHAKLQATISNAGGKITEIAFCPHHPEDLCSCRKPKPGMLLDLANRFKCKPREMIFVGDKETDIMAAKAIGAEPILIYSSMTKPNLLTKYPALQAFASLAEYVDNLLISQN
ncbi:MAG: D-glycero-beta-D-manno-heptose-1,7-bisphosphate 7-phosphatase [Legionellales bacterium RIFCSPHIGHO2_12_FULL_35_11]|nr:MAG: D-glycero-beta-D-manno-heptose-1,7-bisphosphate 7-phosphatase [Legionellales bacterium RIFCSPHIGHO2_12_FULL_35_11]